MATTCIRIPLFLAVVLSSIFNARAATSTWSGATDGKWSTNTNWDVPPAAGSDLIFPTGAANPTNTNDTAITTFNSITFTGAGSAYNLSGGAITLTNGINHSTTNAATIGIIIPISMNTTQTVSVATIGSHLNLGSNLSGSGGLTKTGAGDLTLNNSVANTFTGTTTVLNGSLTLSGSVVSIPGALVIGDATHPANTATVSQTASNVLTTTSMLTINPSGGYTISANASTVSTTIGAVTINGGSLTVTASGQIVPFTVSGFATLTSSSLTMVGGTVTVLGSASSGFSTLNPGPVTLTQGQITSGILGTINLNGDVTTLAANNPSMINGGGGAVALSANRTFTIADGGSSNDLVVSALMTGAFGITKAGSGRLSLQSAQGYTGMTLVNAGSVVINGNLAGGVLVPGGGTFGGTGSMTTFTGSGGTIAGTVPGILSPSAGMTLNSGTTWIPKLNGTDAGTGFDQFHVTGGAISLGGTLSGTLGFVSNVGDSFTIIKNDTGAPIIGTFAGLPEGSTFAISGVPFSITYLGTRTGDDGVITHINLNSTMTLTALPTTSAANAPVILTATAIVAAGTPTGTVTFLDGNTTLGTATLVNGVATLVVTTLGPGPHSITASYTGDTNFSSSGSGPVTVTVAVSGGGANGGAPTATQMGLTDTDGDGFPDSLETSFGTSPTNATDTPFGGQSAPTPLPLVDIKLTIKLDFSKKNNDSESLSGTLVAAQGFSPAGKKVGVQIGNNAQVFTLDAKGAAKSGNSSIKINLKGTAAQSAKFAMKVSKSSLSEGLAQFGLTSTATANVNVPIFMTFNNSVYTIPQPASYAANGKTGLAKNKK
jgi:autotransporter-associated beta strand protein